MSRSREGAWIEIDTIVGMYPEDYVSLPRGSVD